MKTVVFLFILFSNVNVYSQDQTKNQKKLDSLKTVKLDYENRIEKINKMIKEVEDKITISELGNYETLKYIVSSESLKIRKKDDSSADILFQPKKGEIIELIDYGDFNDYWKVSYKNSFGYVNDVFIQQTSEIQNFKKILIAKKTLKAEEQKLLNTKRLAGQKENRKKDLIKRYGAEIANKILAGKIWLGMSSEMAKESWGLPEQNNRTVGTWGTHEQWVYGDTYLYFENGTLTSWQDSK
jgi:hypothetical protein